VFGAQLHDGSFHFPALGIAEQPSHVDAMRKDDVLKYALEFCQIHQEQPVLLEKEINERFLDGCVVTVDWLFCNQLTDNDPPIRRNHIFFYFRLFGIGIDRILAALQVFCDRSNSIRFCVEEYRKTAHKVMSKWLQLLRTPDRELQLGELLLY